MRPAHLVMPTDSVNGEKAASESVTVAGGKAKDSIQVVGVAQLLLDSVRTPIDPVGEADAKSEPEPVK